MKSLSVSERNLKMELSARDREAVERLETIRELTDALGAMVARVQQEHVPRAEYESLKIEHGQMETELATVQTAYTGAQAAFEELQSEHLKLRVAHEELQEDTTRLYETLRSLCVIPSI